MSSAFTKGDAPFELSSHDYDIALHKGLAITGESKHYYASQRVEWLRQRLASFQFRPASILDFGCGAGTSIPFLQKFLEAKRIVGIDTSERLLSDAQATYATDNVDFRLMRDFSPLNQAENNRFDLAFCNGVFHHIPEEEREDAIKYIFHCLKPGGIFAFWENNPYNLGTRIVMSRIPFDRDAKTLKPKKARALLFQSGFSVLETTFIFIFPRWLSPLRIFEPHLTKHPFGAQYLVLAQKLSQQL